MSDKKEKSSVGSYTLGGFTSSTPTHDIESFSFTAPECPVCSDTALVQYDGITATSSRFCSEKCEQTFKSPLYKVLTKDVS